jgi:hypothetical protein
MRNKLLSLFFISLVFSALAQTNPSPQQIPYSQDFSSLEHSSSIFPDGWQGWNLGSGVTSSFRLTPPIADESLNATSTASSTAGGVHNFNDKIGLLATGTKDPAIVLAISTLGEYNVRVAFEVMTMRNNYDGANQTRINEVILQYRIGTSGNFINLLGLEYQNNQEKQTTGIAPQNLQLRGVFLPESCDNQPVVQLRWLVRDLGGSGNRQSFAIDNIVVCANAPLQPQSINGQNEVCNGDTVVYSTPFDAGAISYQWTLPSGLTGSSNSNSISVLTSGAGGTISVVAINACGSSVASTLEVVVNELPIILVDAADSEICPGDQTILTANGAAAYVWQPGTLIGSSININPFTTTLYTVVGTDQKGCANSSEIEITVFTLTTPEISVDGNNLTSTLADSYQWNFNGTPISGAENRAHTATQTGNYSVTITTQEGCTSTSNEVYVNVIGIASINKDDLIQIFPNPNNGYFTISNSKGVILKILDITGRDITAKIQVVNHNNSMSIDMRDFSSGVYWLQLKNADVVKVERIVVR